MPIDGIKVNLGNAIKATFPKTGELHDLARTGWKLQRDGAAAKKPSSTGNIDSRNKNNICPK